MASTFSPNLNLELVGRNDQVGIWDTPENSDWSIVDRSVGGITTIGLNNSPVVLSGAQFQSAAITFNSTLTGSVAITFPTSFTKSYKIRNVCTGSSVFVVTLATTASGGQAICCPPGESMECVNDGTNLYYHNLERVGTYWDYAGSSVPAWVSGCTVAPYLNCDGTAFSSATFPQLAVILAGTTLPDARGRFRAALNQTTGRLTSSQGGVDGNTVLSASGLQTTTLGTSNLPPYTPAVSSASFSVQQFVNLNLSGASISGSVANGNNGNPNGVAAMGTVSVTMQPQGGTNVPLSNVPPAYIGGLTLIRSA